MKRVITFEELSERVEAYESEKQEMARRMGVSQEVDEKIREFISEQSIRELKEAGILYA